MSCIRCSLLFCFLSSVLHAESVVILQGDRAWYCPSEKSTAVSVDRVIRISGGPVTPPNEPPNQPPEDGSELKMLSSTWIVKVTSYGQREHHRQSLAATYMLLSQQVKSGTFSNLSQLKTVTTRTRDIILGPDRGKWDRWGQDIAAHLSSNVDSLDEAADAYLEIAAGLEKSEAIRPETLEFILMIIKLIMTLIGGGV